MVDDDDNIEPVFEGIHKIEVDVDALDRYIFQGGSQVEDIALIHVQDLDIDDENLPAPVNNHNLFAVFTSDGNEEDSNI